MTIQRFTVYKRLRHSLNSVSELCRSCRFLCVPFLNCLSRVPIIAITLNQQVKTRDVKIKDESLPHLKLGDNAHALRFDNFPDSTLNRRFSLTSPIAAEGAKTPSGFQLGRRAPEFLATRFAGFENGRAARALNRAVRITRRVRQWYAERLAALCTRFAYLPAATFGRAKHSRLSSALRERELLSALATYQRRVAVSPPSSFNRAGSTVRTKEVTGLSRSWLGLSACNTVGVNVVSSQWRDLQMQVARLVRAACGVSAPLRLVYFTT